MRRKSNLGKYLAIIILLAIASGAGFIYLSPQFEKQKPQISFKENLSWNLKSKPELSIYDESGIKYYKVIFKDGLNEVILNEQVIDGMQREISLDLKAPKLDMFFKSKSIEIIVEAIDNSKWNFLEGNKIVKTYNVAIDQKRPSVEVIANSYAIRKGGSAIAIVKVEDENLKDAYISFSGQERFELIPFMKEGYYMSLIAWPVTVDRFTQVSIEAIDTADNHTIVKIPYYIRKLKVRDSNIKISDSFIQNISSKVLESSSKPVPNRMRQIFLKKNQELRAENVQTIRDISVNNMDKEPVNGFDIKPFKRLTNAATVGQYANKRHYYHDGDKIDESWHLGIDWASVKKAPVYTNNAGRVIFNDYLGIYGNTIIIDHQYGLQSLYAHTSASTVNLAQEVNAGDQIGNTGTTGAVFGDHLHFGVLIQGVEVNPLEWMDKNWIRTRILDVIKDAKEAIKEQ